MQTFQAILYGGDLPLAGQAVTANFIGELLLVKAHSISVNGSQIVMGVGGFEHNEFYLHWQTPDGVAMSLKLHSKNDIAIVMADAPASLSQQFGKWQQRQRSIKMVWGSLASLAIAVVFGVLLLWSNYDNALGWMARQVSVPQEEQLGKSVLAQIESQGGTIKKGVAFNAVKSVGERLTENSRYHYQWLIKKDKTVNAFALPGGIIIVHSGLIAKAENADELAAVLAHEVQHVERQHALKNMINSLGWAAALMVLLGDVNTATAVIVHQLGNLVFSRDSEDEADRLGLQALIHAKIKPDGMVSLLQKLAKEPGADVPEWLSSHPDIQARIATVQQMLKQQACPTCLPLALDWQKVQADQALLKGDS
ncbi:hypothetical protein JCM14076_16510 [Methylosoma difficile]